MSGALCHYGMAGEEQARLERSKRDCCAEHGIDRDGPGRRRRGRGEALEAPSRRFETVRELPSPTHNRKPYDTPL